MQEKNRERRRVERVIFDIKEGLTAALRDIENNNVRAHVYILNISENGMQFTTKSSDRAPFQIEERAILSDLYSNDDKYQNLNIEIVIRWILNPPLLKYIGIGCEFIRISDASKGTLDKILASKRT